MLCGRDLQDSCACQVVSGPKDGVSHYWNVIPEGEWFYHVDLLRCTLEGGFSLKNPTQLSGYVWDYAIYPLEDVQIAETEPEIQPEN